MSTLRLSPQGVSFICQLKADIKVTPLWCFIDLSTYVDIEIIPAGGGLISLHLQPGYYTMFHLFMPYQTRPLYLVFTETLP